MGNYLSNPGIVNMIGLLLSPFYTTATRYQLKTSKMTHLCSSAPVEKWPARLDALALLGHRDDFLQGVLRHVLQLRARGVALGCRHIGQGVCVCVCVCCVEGTLWFKGGPTGTPLLLGFPILIRLKPWNEMA